VKILPVTAPETMPVMLGGLAVNVVPDAELPCVKDRHRASIARRG
jgi:hypothetical protein